MMDEDTGRVDGARAPFAKAVRRASRGAFACMLVLALGLSLPGAFAYADDAGASSKPSSSSGTMLQAGAQSDSTAPAKRTVMLYLCGADLEEDAGMASINLRQILESNFGNGEDVRFVVMTGGSYRWDLERDYLVFPDDVDVPKDAVQKGNPIFDEEVTVVDDPKSQISGPYNQIWEVKSTGAADNPGKLVLLDGDGLKNHRADLEGDEEWMSNPETLKGFIDFSVENFPAEKYDLILWDHGGGPTSGFAIDNRREQVWFGANAMTFGQILEALKNNKVTNQGDDDPSNDSTFDFVNFDACLMGSAEIAMGIADYTDYYIASPETVPGRGQVYTGWLNELGENPDASTPDLGKKIVDDFIAYYDAGYEDGTRQEGTMALINTKKLLESGFVEALSTIGDALRSQVESGQVYDELRSVKSSIVYEGGEFYDLGNLVSHVAVSLWELDPEAVDDSTINYSNEEYTAAAKTILGILSNPDIVYAGDTTGIGKKSRFFMDAEGTVTAGASVIRSSGLHLFFPSLVSNVVVDEYEDAIQEALEVMPEDGRSAFLEKYVRTMHEFALVRMVGREVTGIVNSGDYDDKENIDYQTLRGYWERPAYPGVAGLEEYSCFSTRIKPYFESMFGVRRADDATVAKWEEELLVWLDDVVKQQAREAVSAKNVTAQSFVTRGGEGSKVTIADTRRRVVDSVRMDVVAELPAVRAYIEKHDEGLSEDDGTYSYLIERGRADLPLGSIYATMDASMDTIEDFSGDFLRDYVKWFNDATTTTWNVGPTSDKWYAIKDAGGNLHVSTNDEATLSATVPVIRLRNGEIGEHPELNLLGFTDGKLAQIYLRDDEGNARIIKASDLQTEMEVIPALYIDGIVSTVLPASASSFMVTPDNIDDINLVYTDISNIPDIQDVDGDSSAIGFKYVVSDIYGTDIDISEQVNNPTGTIIDIRLAKVESAKYTGEELAPTLTYGGKTLVEGVDYFWEKDNEDEAFVLPGEYGITVYGYGNFADMMIGTFVIEPADDDPAKPSDDPAKPSDGDDPAKPSDVHYKIETLDGAPVISSDNMEDVASNVLAKDELDAGYSLLLVSSPYADGAVPKADKSALTAKADSLGATVGAWFDVSLYKVRGDERVGLAEVSTPLHLTAEVPASLHKDGRTFYLLRYHDGAAEVVAESTETTLAWDADKFSTYTIAYKDSSDTPAAASGKDGKASSSTPKTGDPFKIAVVAVAVVAVVAAGAAVFAMRRRNKDR